MRACLLARACLTDRISRSSCPLLSHACAPVAVRSASQRDPNATVLAAGASETSSSAYTNKTRCEEGRDVRDHFTELMTMREQLAGMGAAIDERDFYAIVLGSLPESYRPLLSAISATAHITQKTLTTYELVNVITEEYEHRQIAGRGSSKKGANNSALSVRTRTGLRCYSHRCHLVR